MKGRCSSYPSLLYTRTASTETGLLLLTACLYYERAGWKVEESEYKEATQEDDNTESIEKFGRGYIARYVMLERALDELREKVTFIED